MLGPDLPIERLRSGFAPLYGAYDEIFAGYTASERHMLLAGTAMRWYWSRRDAESAVILGS